MSITTTFSVIQTTNEFQVNSFETGNQLAPDIVGLGNGGFVAAYNNGNLTDGTIAIDFYDPAHEQLSSFEVPTADAVGQPQVTELANGNVLITWIDGEAPLLNLRGRVFEADGTPVGGEIFVDTVGADIQVTAMAGGGFVVSDTRTEDVFQARFNNAGQDIGATSIVNAVTTGIQSDAAVAALSTGGYVVTYTDNNPADQVLRARIYNADGTTTVADFALDGVADNTQSKVVGLDGGNWAVAYTDTGWGGDDAGNSAITLKIFNGNGNGLTGFIRVNAPSTEAELEPDITVLDNGFIAVTWTKQISFTDFNVQGRIYTPEGVAVTDEFTLSLGSGADRDAAVAGLLNGEFATVWFDNTPDSSGTRLSGAISALVRTTTGDEDANVIVGDGMRDIVNGGGGGDSIFGVNGDDQLNGGSGGDILEGGSGADILRGGADGDTYFVDNTGDVVDEGIAGSDGVDKVNASISINLSDVLRFKGDIENAALIGAANSNVTGNGLDNQLTGNDGNNTLIGLGGADTMLGLGGNDLYGVAETGDVVDESAAGSSGIDTVNATVSVDLSDAVHFKGAIENAKLLGNANLNLTGNGLDNLLIGNAGNNTLIGLGGADTMRGGAGNDLYGVAEAGDVIDESVAGSSGIDTVNATVSVDLSDAVHFKGAIENAKLLGNANLNLTGNGLDNLLIGSTGNNTLIGLAGADTMRGGAGNDLYGVAEAGDIVDESVAGSSGIDTVNASISININDAGHFKGAIENATLIGSANLSLTGNTLGNVLKGNAGVNVITGWLGSDTLTGGGGNDVFQFNSALNAATNVDTITDMNEAGNDTVQLENSVFTTLAAGALTAGSFRIGAAAADADDRIIYNSLNGQLIYDSNGNAGGGATAFAILDPGLALTAADFFVV